MIHINLVPQRRPRQSDQGQQSLLLGVLAVIVVVAAMFFLWHQPLSDGVEALQSDVRALDKENKAKKDATKDVDKLDKEIESGLAKNQTIQRLSQARALPAHLMWELSNLVRSAGTPTMTQATSRELAANENRQPSTEWDATHVWITSFKEKSGSFTLTGGAQSDSDMTQLALRMQASVYFREVVPEGGSVAVDKESGITYYKFTIAGKVAY